MVHVPGFGKLKKLGPAVIEPNVFRPPHKMIGDENAPIVILVKNGDGAQVFNADVQQVKT